MKKIEVKGTTTLAPATAAPLMGLPTTLPAMPASPGLLPSTPWIGFFSRKSGKVGEVLQSLPDITEGTPYLCVDNKYYSLDGTLWAIIDAKQAFCQTDGEGVPIKAWRDKSADAIKANAKEHYHALVVVLPDKTPLGAPVGPAIVATCNFRGPKARAVHDHLSELGKATDTDWLAKANPVAASCQSPAFRVVSKIQVTAKPARSGFTYHLARAFPRPLDSLQAEALGQWWADEKNQQTFEQAQKFFNDNFESLPWAAQ